MDSDESNCQGVPSTKQEMIIPTTSRSETSGANLSSKGDDCPNSDEVSTKATDQLEYEEVFHLLSLEDREHVDHKYTTTECRRI
jgi:hypothetical protein